MRFSIALVAAMLAAAPALAEQKPAPAAAATAAAPAAHSHGAVEKTAANGYFQDSEVGARPLSDWAGDWQSAYPLLTSGALDKVMAHKAEHGDKTAAEYRSYYETGYQTDISAITIDGDKVTFTSPKGKAEGTYASDGHEILTYEDGHRAVRFAFRKTAGDAAAPALIVFSDHKIAPQKADHFHLYMGDDRAKLFAEKNHWPTYFPAKLSPAEVADDLMGH